MTTLIKPVKTTMKTLRTDERTLLLTSETAKPNKPLRPLWSLIIAFAVILGPARINADSATWKLDPTSNDWNTAANWTPETVPDQQTDIATFGVSNVTNVDVTSSGGVGIGGITFSSGSSAYFIGGVDIAFFGAGVINNSGITQNISPGLLFSFTGNATAGTEMVYTSDGSELGPVGFSGSSNAGTATFIMKGNTGGQALALLWFFDTSSAASSTIVLQQGDPGGRTEFLNNSTAGDSTITVEPGAVLQFDDDATGAAATLIAEGGTIYFLVRSNGQQARVELTNGGVLNVNPHDTTAPMSIGSLEGDTTGVVLLGQGQLTLGGDGLSTTFNGQIRQGGSLVKTGNERLILTGANTYAGGTTINGGTLLAQAAIGSATGTGPVQVNSGTLGGTGNVTGAVTVGTGTGPRAFLVPGVNGPGALSILNTLTFKSDGSYKYELGLTPHPRADQVSANGVTVESGARFVLRARGNQTLPLGTIFTVINNTAATPISGTFANLPDGSTIVAGNNTLQVNYEGGDGNDLTLTVVP
jgi:autotransporter-associated beta strand protein